MGCTDTLPVSEYVNGNWWSALTKQDLYNHAWLSVVILIVTITCRRKMSTPSNDKPKETKINFLSYLKG